MRTRIGRLVGAAGFEPTTSCSQIRAPGVVDGSSRSQPPAIIQDRRRAIFQASHPSTGFSKNFATPVLPDGQDEPCLQKKSPSPRMDGNTLLTAKEVANRLRVCTATIYKLCASGALPHVRVLNAVRVDLEELNGFLARQSQKGMKS